MRLVLSIVLFCFFILMISVIKEINKIKLEPDYQTKEKSVKDKIKRTL